MTEKVKVSREVAEILERTISNFDGDKAFIIANYVRGGCGGFWRDDFNVMRELSDDALFKALYVGYEIEETAEDKVLALWKENDCSRTHFDSKLFNYQKGVTETILKILDFYQIKIKGINE